MKYNQLTILEEVNYKKRWMFKTQCDCGRVEIKRKDWVLSGRTTSCKSCASKRTAKQYPMPVHRTGYKELSGTHYFHIKNGATKRNISFEVSAEYLYKLWVQQDCTCALTGLPIYLTNKIKNNNPDWSSITASVDRKDSSKGYTEENVWWVHKEVNRLKNNYSIQELVYWCSLIVKTHGNPDPSIEKEITVSMKEQRLDGEDSTNNPSTSAQHPNKDEDIV